MGDNTLRFIFRDSDGKRVSGLADDNGVVADRHRLAKVIIVLGVSGSIAAYKACEVASRLVARGARVLPVLTDAAQKLVGPATFEALTAKDRPYKEGKKLSESLRILGLMKQDNHIDPDLFDVFVTQKVYAKYAQRFLDPEQIDKANAR